jgi:ParB family chromosome partitioning protein
MRADQLIEAHERAREDAPRRRGLQPAPAIARAAPPPGPRPDAPQVANVPVDRLLFHPRNVRKDLGDLRELAGSIAAEGVLCPVMAERRGQMLRLLAGHRRVAAARLAGLRKVPCVVVAEHDDDQAIAIMLAENLNRAGLSRDEKRAAVRSLRDEFGYTVEGIAQRLGVSEATVYAWSRDPDHLERKSHSPATKAQQSARIGPSKVHDLVTRWEGNAPPELIAELRDLLGGWEPAQSHTKRLDGSTSVSPDLVERVAWEDRGGGVGDGAC